MSHRLIVCSFDTDCFNDLISESESVSALFSWKITLVNHDHCILRMLFYFERVRAQNHTSCSPIILAVAAQIIVIIAVTVAVIAIIVAAHVAPIMHSCIAVVVVLVVASIINHSCISNQNHKSY